MESREDESPAPLIFLFGNVDERNRVDADYLDEDAKEHLAGLARLQGGLDLQASPEELQAEQAADGSGAATAAVQPAADARDFADEVELIEDAEQQQAAAAAAAEQQRQMGLVSVALQAEAAAEAEDYDFDEEEDAEQPAVATAAAAAAAAARQQELLAAPVAEPALPTQAQPPAVPAARAGVAAAGFAAAAPAAAPLTAAPAAQGSQLAAAQQRRVRLPVLGQSVDGETVLRFSDLYGHQGVMAGHVSAVDELLPPLLLVRGQRQQQPASATTGAIQAAELADEESLLAAAYLEVPAEDGEEQEEAEEAEPLLAGHEAPLAAGSLGAAEPAQLGGQPQPDQPRSAEDQHSLLAPPLQQQGGVAEAEPGTSDMGLGGSSLSSTFTPVNALPWEERICWQGAAKRAGMGAEPGLDEEVGNNAVQQEEPAGALPAGQQALDGQLAASLAAGGEQQHHHQEGTRAAIAAVFGQPQQQVAEPQQQLPATQYENGLPVVFMPPAVTNAGQGGSSLPVVQHQQQGAAGWQQQEAAPAWQQHLSTTVAVQQLPGLSSSTAADVEARAAADSDDEECWALPTAPLLRLEYHPPPPEDDDGHRTSLRRTLYMQPEHDTGWEARITWTRTQGGHQLRMEGPVFDLNDSSQAFELTKPVLHQAAAERLQLGTAARAGTGLGVADLGSVVERAAALVIQPQAVALPLPPRGSGFDPGQAEEVDLWQLQQGLAREREYHQPARRKAGTGAVVRVLHAKLASDLATIPILNPTPHTQEEVLALALWHTPRGRWWPLEVGRVSWNMGGGKKGKGGASGPIAITIVSLPGFSKVFQAVGLDTRLQDLWKHLVDNIPQFKPAEGSQPLMLVPGRPPVLLPLDQPVVATGAVMVGQKQVKLTIAFQDIELLHSHAVETVPDNDNPALLRPPNAFTRKRDFSAAEPGHVVLLEYMEQQPPLLNRPGMGAKLLTYYRKRNAKDTEYQKLKEVAPRWLVGGVQPLGDDDDSPFLGQLAPGSSSLSVESGLFRSLAYPYVPLHTDFLLLRSPAGTMQLRELSGTVIIGQELPMHRVPAPTAREVKDLEERRIYVHVFKHLRRQQAKLDKDPATQGHRASITLKALAEAFPSRPPAMIRAYLKDACNMAVQQVGETEYFSLKAEARPPSEAELRKKLTPEEACTLEACYVAAFRMKQRGLVMHEKLDKAAIEKLRLAAEMLPPEESYQKAARLVEQAMQSAPWALTDAFVTHFREGKAQLQLAGAADPTGRGFGYSFVRDVRHKHANSDDVTKQMAKRQAGKVQGTDADLRRMTTAQAKERLRGYGLSEEEIQGLGRWTMIDMVRQLASAAAQDGTVDAAAVKFVRHQKTTLIELQRRAAEKAQQIFEKQLAVLNNTASEDLGDQDALEAELEQELAAAEAAEAEGGTGGPTPQGKKGNREGTPTPDDEQHMMQQMRAEGLMAAQATPSAAAPSGAPAAAAGGPAPKEGAGARRIRREVFLKAADGSWQKSHEVIYTGRDRPGQLHSLYQKEGTGNYPFGFGTRTIAGQPKDLRLSYAAARGRGMGRSGGRGAGAGRGAGRGRGSRAAAMVPEDASPEAVRARQSSRQRKQRQFGDDVLEDIASDDGDFDYNEETEAPYFAATMQPPPAQPRKKKQKKAGAAGEAGVQPAAAQQAQAEGQAGEGVPMPEDFAAAIAAAAMVRAPSTGVALDVQQAAAAEAAPVQAEAAAGTGPEQAAGLDVLLPPQQQQQQDVQQPAASTQAAPKPKLKIKLGGAAAPQPQQPRREPSPEFVYDFTVPDEAEEEGRRRPGRADDADYEVQQDADAASDEFLPDEEELSEEDPEERMFRKKAQARSRARDGATPSRAGSRRSGGSVRSRGGGGGARRPAAGSKKGGGGGARSTKGGAARQRKRSRVDYEEFEEEDDADITEEDEDEFEVDDAGTSDEGATPQPSSKQHTVAGSAAGAGQLDMVGRNLGAILNKILQQLRNAKMLWGNQMTKTYDLVFGKVPSSTSVPDYFNFVPKSSVIILPEMQKKAKAGRYISLEMFRADLQQLHQNAINYNTPGCGSYGDPFFIELAAKLRKDAESLIAQRMDEIQTAIGGSAL